MRSINITAEMLFECELKVERVQCCVSKSNPPWMVSEMTSDGSDPGNEGMNMQELAEPTVHDCQELEIIA